MAAPEERPPRFECPANFAPCPFSPGPAFSQETLQSPSKQLWLIRAPANFSPESLDGRAVPLLGSQMLKVPQTDGTQVYSFQAAPGELDSAHLLIPSGRQDHLTGAPSFSGSLSICQRYGDPSCNQPLFPVAARLAPQVPEGLRQRFLPFGGHPQSPSLREAAEGPPRKRKKKHQLHSMGYMEDPTEQGSQLSSQREGSSQETLFSGGLVEPSLRSKKKKKKQQLKEEEELLAPSSQAQQSDLEPCVPGAEGLGLCKPKKRRRQREEEEAAAAAAAAAMAAPVDITAVKEEAEGGHWDFRGLGATPEDSIPSGKRKKKKKVLAEEPPSWEQGAAMSGGGEELGTRCGPGTGVEEQPLLPGAEETSHKHKKKKKKHKRAAAAEEESWAS